jgi:hypothetical protein
MQTVIRNLNYAKLMLEEIELKDLEELNDKEGDKLIGKIRRDNVNIAIANIRDNLNKLEGAVNK